jgi:hypothetical protein
VNKFDKGSLKHRVVETVHRLGRSSCWDLILCAKLSAPENVDAATKGLLRDGYLIGKQEGGPIVVSAIGLEAIGVDEDPIDLQRQSPTRAVRNPQSKWCPKCKGDAPDRGLQQKHLNGRWLSELLP